MHVWFVRRKGVLDEGNKASILDYVEKLREIFSQGKISNGFAENHFEGCPPFWISAAFQAVMAYKLVGTSHLQDPTHMDTSLFMESLTVLAGRYKLAGRQMIFKRSVN